MKKKQRLITPALSGTIAVLLSTFVASPAAYSQSAASAKPIEGKAGQTFSVTLKEKQRQDFNLDLPKGEFFVYCDGKIVDDTPRIFGAIELLKRNGAKMPNYTGDLKFWAQNERVWREGAKFRLSAPTGIRLRLKNTGSETNTYWVKVVPTTNTQFVPFGYKIPVIPAKIGSNNGAGGTLEPSQVVYQRATIPAGKWSISLGAQAEEARAYVTLTVLDAKGLASNYPYIISNAGETGGEVRQEKILTFTKPTTLIFRVWNEGESISYPTKYDVTIEPAT